MEYYKILGVGKDATFEEIRAAYKKLSKKLHPDKGGNVDKFVKMQEAYECLRNPEMRKYYDEHGEKPKQTSTIESQAQEQLCILFKEACRKFGRDMIYKNIFKEITQQLNKKDAELETSLNSVREILVILVKQKKRIKPKKSKTFLVHALDGEVHEMKNKIKEIFAVKQVIILAHRLLKDFELLDLYEEPPKYTYANIDPLSKNNPEMVTAVIEELKKGAFRGQRW